MYTWIYQSVTSGPLTYQKHLFPTEIWHNTYLLLLLLKLHKSLSIYWYCSENNLSGCKQVFPSSPQERPITSKSVTLFQTAAWTHAFANTWTGFLGSIRGRNKNGYFSNLAFCFEHVFPVLQCPPVQCVQTAGKNNGDHFLTSQLHLL